MNQCSEKKKHSSAICGTTHPLQRRITLGLNRTWDTAGSWKYAVLNAVLQAHSERKSHGKEKGGSLVNRIGTNHRPSSFPRTGPCGCNSPSNIALRTRLRNWSPSYSWPSLSVPTNTGTSSSASPSSWSLTVTRTLLSLPRNARSRGFSLRDATS